MSVYSVIFISINPTSIDPMCDRSTWIGFGLDFVFKRRSAPQYTMDNELDASSGQRELYWSTSTELGDQWSKRRGRDWDTDFNCHYTCILKTCQIISCSAFEQKKDISLSAFSDRNGQVSCSITHQKYTGILLHRVQSCYLLTPSRLLSTWINMHI